MARKSYNLAALEQQRQDLEIKISKLSAQLTIVTTTIAKAKAQATFERTLESKLGNERQESTNSDSDTQDR